MSPKKPVLETTLLSSRFLLFLVPLELGPLIPILRATATIEPNPPGVRASQSSVWDPITPRQYRLAAAHWSAPRLLRAHRHLQIAPGGPGRTGRHTSTIWVENLVHSSLIAY